MRTTRLLCVALLSTVALAAHAQPPVITPLRPPPAPGSPPPPAPPTYPVQPMPGLAHMVCANGIGLQGSGFACHNIAATPSEFQSPDVGLQSVTFNVQNTGSYAWRDYHLAIVGSVGCRGENQTSLLFLDDVTVTGISAGQFSPPGNRCAIGWQGNFDAPQGVPPQQNITVRLVVANPTIAPALYHIEFYPTPCAGDQCPKIDGFTPIPEPGTSLLLAAGLCALVPAGILRRRTRHETVE